MAAAIQPIGDLYKSQLRAVAERLGVPERILAKPPSADLWPGQTDEGELGASYDDLDRILFALVDRRWSGDRCVRAGLDAGLVARVPATWRGRSSSARPRRSPRSAFARRGSTTSTRGAVPARAASCDWPAGRLRSSGRRSATLGT